MKAKKQSTIAALIIALGSPFVLAESAFAESAGQEQITNFLKSTTSTLAGYVTAIGVLCIVVGGYIYMMSAGNPDRLEKGKNTIKWAAFGMILVLSALALANLIFTTAKGSFTG